MPFVKISGIEKEESFETGENIKNIINLKIGVPRERIRVFYDPMTEIVDGKESDEKNVMIVVTWIKRPQELCDKLAEEVKKYLNSCGYKNITLLIRETSKDKLYSYK